jgi:hypothetical protein
MCISWRILIDWDVILSADCPVGALSHLVCCVEATMVVDPRIPWELGRVFLKIHGCSGPPVCRFKSSLDSGAYVSWFYDMPTSLSYLILSYPVGCGWVHLVLELIAPVSEVNLYNIKNVLIKSSGPIKLIVTNNIELFNFDIYHFFT